jgi:hypothetical protein
MAGLLSPLNVPVEQQKIHGLKLYKAKGKHRDMRFGRPRIGRKNTVAAGDSCGIARQSAVEVDDSGSGGVWGVAAQQVSATRCGESGLSFYGDFEGELPLWGEVLADGGVLLQGAIFEDPAGQLCMNGFLDPLIEQCGNLSAQIRRVI